MTWTVPSMALSGRVFLTSWARTTCLCSLCLGVSEEELQAGVTVKALIGDHLLGM